MMLDATVEHCPQGQRSEVSAVQSHKNKSVAMSLVPSDDVHRPDGQQLVPPIDKDGISTQYYNI